MPDVTGCSFETVNTILHRHDYQAAKSDVSSTDPSGQIVQQSPSAGVTLTYPAHIVLEVSNGMAPASPINDPKTADISVTINEVGSERLYTSGQSIKYGIFIANEGPSNATNIVVDDTAINLNITGVSGACSNFPCKIADLIPASTASIFVTAVITGDGAFNNKAIATHAERDPNPGNDSAIIGGNVDPATNSVDISVTTRLKALGPYRPGDTAVFISDIHNAGPSTALDVRVINTANNVTVTRVSGDCTESNCVIPNVAPGKSAEVVIDATINSNGAFDNTVAASSGQTDLNLNNNSATSVGNTTPLPTQKVPSNSVWPLLSWIWLAGTVVLLTVFATATQYVRKTRWRNRIRVSPSLDRAGVSHVPILQVMSAPEVAIRARLEIGTSHPKGAVPILKEVVEK